MGSDNAFSELCPVCGTEMNDNWIGGERVLICPKCSFYKESKNGMWRKCGKLDGTAIADKPNSFTQGGIASSAGSPILLDGYDSKEEVFGIQSGKFINIQGYAENQVDLHRAEICMKACENFTDEFLENYGIEGIIEAWCWANGIKKEDATYTGKSIWKEK